MQKTLNEIIGLIGSFFQPSLYALIFRYVVLSGSSVPFFEAFILISACFLASAGYTIIQIFSHNNSGLFEVGIDFEFLALTGVLQITYIGCTVFSFSFLTMTIGRYFIISVFIDLLASGLASTFILGREIHHFHWGACGLGLLGFLLHDLLIPDLSGFSNGNFRAEQMKFSDALYTGDYWKPFLCTLISRIAYSLRGIIFKRMQLINHFSRKYANMNKRLDQELKMPINKQYLDDTELGSTRKVSSNSGVAKWAKHFRREYCLQNGIINDPIANIKNDETLNVGLDDYVKYLMEVERLTDYKKNSVLQQIIENEVMQTGNTLHRHLFYLRNKISSGTIDRPALGSEILKSDQVTHTKPEPFWLLHQRNPLVDPNQQNLINRAKNYMLNNIINNPNNNTTNTDNNMKIILETGIKNILNENQTLPINVHLFSGYDDLYLTKLDLMFSTPFFDNILFEFNDETHWVLHSAITVFPCTILFALLSVLNNENMILHYDSGNINLFGNGGVIALVVVFALISVAIPYLNFHSIMGLQHTKFPWICLGIDLFWISLATSFVENRSFPMLPSNWVFGYALAFLAKSIAIYVSDLQVEFQRTESNIRIAQMSLSKQFDNKSQLYEFIDKAHQIYYMLGSNSLNSSLLDSVIAGYFYNYECRRNKRMLNYTAPPVLPFRDYFDPLADKGYFFIISKLEENTVLKLVIDL